MARKCSAESSHRATGIVEKEAIVLLFLYFSTSASFLAFVPMFFLHHRFLPSRFQHHYTWRSAVFVWIVSRKREKEEKQKESKKGNEKGRWKKRDWGMKGTNDCRFAGGFWCPRDAALWLFMLLIHKFLVNSAYERPSFYTLTYPRCCHSAPSSGFFLRSLLLFFLSFIPVPLDFRIPDPSDLRPILILLRDRSYVYKSVTKRGDDRRRNFRIYWSHSRLLSALLRRWLVPTSSRESYSILPAAGGILCPINLRHRLLGGNRAIGYAHYRVISEELFV